MGKLSKKLVVYLDQNFISEIAKVDINKNVSQDYKILFDLIHRGFIEEKLIVPKSFFHRIETSMIERLAERIGKFQSYMGQISLHHSDILETFQFVRAAKEFLGEKQDSIDWGFAYEENPDNRLQHFDVTIKSGSYLQLFVQGNEETLAKIHQLQRNIKGEKVTFAKQAELEMSMTRSSFIKNDISEIGWIFKNDIEKIKEFANSKDFIIPKNFIHAHMWARLLTTYNHRTIKKGDFMDIDIISAYLPYVDVFATDSFMGRTIKELGLDKKYNTEVFLSQEENRTELINFLDNYLKSNPPVNIPAISVFVKSDAKIKEDSWEFFRKLGGMTMNDRTGWLELFAFDDGEMPKYFDSRINRYLPFYGLQDVDVIKLTTEGKVIEECRKHCRSKQFVLIDSHREIPDDFKETLIGYCKTGNRKILGYNIYDV